MAVSINLAAELRHVAGITTHIFLISRSLFTYHKPIFFRVSHEPLQFTQKMEVAASREFVMVSFVDTTTVNLAETCDARKGGLLGSPLRRTNSGRGMNRLNSDSALLEPALAELTESTGPAVCSCSFPKVLPVSTRAPQMQKVQPLRDARGLPSTWRGAIGWRRQNQDGLDPDALALPLLASCRRHSTRQQCGDIHHILEAHMALDSRTAPR